MDESAGSDQERGYNRRQVLKGFGYGTAAISLPALLAACARMAEEEDEEVATDPGSAGPDPDEEVADGPRVGGTFVMAVGLEIPEMDPHRLQTFANLQMYSAPFRRHPSEYGQFLPDLAESVDVSADGLEYTLHLRPGVTFHDGTPFDADAFVFSLERQAYEDHPHHVGGPFWADWAGGNPGKVSAIEAVDDLTVRIELSEPVLDMDFVLADAHGMAAVNPQVVEADPEHFGQEPFGAGTGPFMFEERVAEDRIALVRFDDYWEEGKPYLDRWVLRVMPDPGTRLLALKNGDIHMFDVSGPEIDQLTDDPDIELITAPPIFGNFIAFDHTDEIVGQPEVRQAISHALDLETLVNQLSPFATVTPNFGVFPGMPGHREDIEWYGYDPDAARDLLAEAGYPDGVEITLSFSTPPAGLNMQVLGQAIQGQLEEVGITAQLDQVDGPTMFEAGFGPPGREEFPFQMALALTGSDGNPLAMFSAWASRSNYAGHNPAYMELFGRMQAAVDEEERLGVYGEMQQLLYDDVAYIPLAHTEVVRAVAKNVRGMETAAYNFQDVWFDDAE
jgi:peptide/nickel transport system substrate-binding protein